VIWPDLSSVFGSNFVYLEPHYPKLKQFFTEGLGVASKVGEEEYAKAWLRLTEQKDTSPDKVEPALEEILDRLVLLVRREARPEWWEGFKARARIWSEGADSRKGFVAPQGVLVPDDPEYRDMFVRKWGIWFAWMPKRIPFPKVSALYRELGARALSEEVRVELAGSGASAQPQKACFLTSEAKQLIARKIQTVDREAYESLRKNGLLESLLRTEEYKAPGLRLRVHLDRRQEEREAKVFWDVKARRLFVDDRGQDQEIFREILARELCRHLFRGLQDLDLKDFIHKALTANEARAKHFIETEHLTLPDEEMDWLRKVLGEPQPEQAVATTEETLQPSPSPPGELRGPVTTRGEKTGETRKKTRLRSYVETSQPEGLQPEADLESERSQEQVERAGIEAVLQYEREHGRFPRERGHSASGWDIESYEQTEDGRERLVRRIEVKALKGEWDEYDIGLTKTEFWEARNYENEYYLYVVEHTLDRSRRKLYIIRGPATKADEFRFDGEWKKISDEVAP
jgi:hypothetical protein